MAVTRTKQEATASSQKVVANATEALFQQQNFSEFVLGTSPNGQLYRTTVVEAFGKKTTKAAGSLMPGRVPLNARVTEYVVNNLQEAAKNALQIKNETRLLADTPTAEYVTRSSFKIGNKLLIKVAPTKAATKIDDSIPNLVFDKFSLQGIAEPDEERYQLHETFESEVLFLFGRRPRIWTLQGIVLNGRRAPDDDLSEEDRALFTQQDLNRFEAERRAKSQDFCNQLLQDWEDFYRGTKAVELRARTYVSYEDSIIEGTLLGLTVVRNAQIPAAVNATITFVVHQRAFVGQEFRDGITLPNLADLIAKTNSAGGSAEKVKPTEIVPAQPSAAEIARRENEAQKEVQKAQEKAQQMAEEKAAVEKAIGEHEAAASQAKSAAAAYEEELAQADADLLEAEAFGDAAAAADAQARIDEAAREISEAKKAEAEAKSQLQALQSRKEQVETELSEIIATEEDKKAKNTAFVAMNDNAGYDENAGKEVVVEFIDPETGNKTVGRRLQ